jgi:uncharacterized damage-inducible protein DinB
MYLTGGRNCPAATVGRGRGWRLASLPVSAHLADQLRRAFEGGAWHGPAVLELLADVDAARAAALPISNAHSIWELTLHIAAWLDAVRRRLHGDPAQLDATQDFPPVTAFSAAAWADARERLISQYEALRQVIEAMPTEDLERKVPGHDYTARFLLEGVIQHSLYHAGQIALLKKLTGERERALLRHTVATVAYRAGKAVRGAPATFATFRAGETTRTPVQVLAHMGDLFDWALSMASGSPAWNDSKPLPWPSEVDRFFTTVRTFDDYLASAAPLAAPVEKLFQGPVADALNHTGQIAMLRRLASAPIRGESYFKADIAVGRVGSEQAAPRAEFE